MQKVHSAFSILYRVCMVTGSGEGQAELKECRNCFCVAFSPSHYDEGIKVDKFILGKRGAR